MKSQALPALCCSRIVPLLGQMLIEESIPAPAKDFKVAGGDLLVAFWSNVYGWEQCEANPLNRWLRALNRCIYIIVPWVVPLQYPESGNQQHPVDCERKNAPALFTPLSPQPLFLVWFRRPFPSQLGAQSVIERNPRKFTPRAESHPGRGHGCFTAYPLVGVALDLEVRLLGGPASGRVSGSRFGSRSLRLASWRELGRKKLRR